jgi:hypothetical protein
MIAPRMHALGQSARVARRLPPSCKCFRFWPCISDAIDAGRLTDELQVWLQECKDLICEIGTEVVDQIMRTTFLTQLRPLKIQACLIARQIRRSIDSARPCAKRVALETNRYRSRFFAREFSA